MIRTFKDRATAATFAGAHAKRIPANLRQRAAEKLALLDAVTYLNDLRLPPANRLEALKGDRQGQWSIRINQQWRVCFRWEAGDACDVEIVDYH